MHDHLEFSLIKIGQSRPQVGFLPDGLSIDRFPACDLPKTPMVCSRAPSRSLPVHSLRALAPSHAFLAFPAHPSCTLALSPCTPCASPHLCGVYQSSCSISLMCSRNFCRTCSRCTSFKQFSIRLNAFAGRTLPCVNRGSLKEQRVENVLVFRQLAIHANLTVCSWLGKSWAGIIAAEKLMELNGFRDGFPKCL